jgi:hypothetical protein
LRVSLNFFFFLIELRKVFVHLEDENRLLIKEITVLASGLFEGVLTSIILNIKENNLAALVEPSSCEMIL